MRASPWFRHVVGDADRPLQGEARLPVDRQQRPPIRRISPAQRDRAAISTGSTVPELVWIRKPSNCAVNVLVPGTAQRRGDTSSCPSTTRWLIPPCRRVVPSYQDRNNQFQASRIPAESDRHSLRQVVAAGVHRKSNRRLNDRPFSLDPGPKTRGLQDQNCRRIAHRQRTSCGILY